MFDSSSKADVAYFKDSIAELNSEALLLDGFDEAIVGYVERIGTDPVVTYDKNKIIEILEREGLTYEEALEHFDYNIIGSWLGEATPFFLTSINDV